MATPVAVFCVFLLFQTVSGEQYRKEGLMDKLSNGMKFAQDILGKLSLEVKKIGYFISNPCLTKYILVLY